MSPLDEPRSPRWVWLGRVALVVATLTALYARRPDAFSNPQFWAEDGNIFYLDARRLGFGSLFVRYSGYFHFYPRTLAWMFARFPVQILPTLYLAGNVAGVLFTALLCTSRRVRLPLGARFMLGFAVTLAPSGNEVFHTLTNTQWILSLTLLLLLLFEAPRNRKQWAFDLLLAAFIALSGPFGLLFSPLFLLGALLQRDRHAWALFAVIALVAAAQLANIAVTRDDGHFGLAQAIDSIHVWNGYLGRTFTGDFGRPPPENLASVIVLFASGGLLYAALLLNGWRQRSPASLYFLAAGAAVLLSTLLAFRGHPERLKSQGDRYFYIPITLLVWALITAWPSQKRAVLPALFVVALAFLECHRSPPMPDYRWREASRCLAVPGPCDVKIPPDWVIHTD